MIKYNLECECGYSFESWFSSSVEYESLIKKKLVNCIQCNSALVKKTLMAPNLSGKSNKIKNNIKFEKIVRKELTEFRKYIEKNCKDVGDNFPQEARSIHYDKSSSKGIYGKATPEEAEELLEEGIDVATVPWIKDEN
jgi:hypothetical protein